MTGDGPEAEFFKWHARRADKKEALQNAKDAGKTEKVARLKKKIKKLTKRTKQARAAMDAALAQEQAVC